MRRIRPQHPRSGARRRRRPSDPGADGLVPGPKAPSQLGERSAPAPLPASSSLTCGSGWSAEAPRGLPEGRGEGGAQGGAAVPPAPQPPPPSGRRLSSQVRARGRASFSSGRRTWNLRVPGRAPSCAQVEAAREAPPGRPSRPQSHGLRLARTGVDAPHLRPVHTCRRLGRHRRGSSPAPPLVRPPAPAAAATGPPPPPPPPRKGGGGNRLPEPEA